MSSPARPGPTKATCFFAGSHDLTQLDEATIAELGIGRKFQKPTVFESHTVEDNILLALKAPRSALSTLFGAAPADQDDAHRSHPGHGAPRRSSPHRLAADLSHGQKQWLEIGMLLAQDPKLLLVEEPVAGMTDLGDGKQRSC